MKGNQKIVTALNRLLGEEHTAIAQYVVHSEMCANWHYDRLAKSLQCRSRVEMKHAEKLVERILFLEGTPEMELASVAAGANVEQIHTLDLALEMGGVASYNDAIRLAVSVGDNTTRELLEQNLKDEEEHVDHIEGQLQQIKDVGLQNYLAEQIRQ